MRRFSLKKLFLIVFVLLFVLIGYSFFARSSQGSAPETESAAADTAPASETVVPPPVQDTETSEAAVQPDVPAVTPVPTEVPELTVTEEFVIELEETESVGGF